MAFVFIIGTIKSLKIPIISSNMMFSRFGSLIERTMNKEHIFGLQIERTMNTKINENMDELEKIKDNPYYKKYSEKIKEIQQNSSKDQLNKIETKLSSRHVEDYQIGEIKDISKQPYKNNIVNKCTYTKQKSLDDVVKMKLLQQHSSEEISKIWQEYHQTKKGIFAVIPGTTYKKIYSNSQQYPVFLYPVPRRKGYEFVLSQFSDHECHFTLLINFQAYKENAPECLKIIHYPELQEEKGIVLMHGEFDDQNLTIQEAQCLTNQLQLYYTGDNISKFNLLKTFNKNSDNFKHIDLVKEFESIA